MDIIRFKQVAGDRVREIRVGSGERAFYDRSPDWVLIEDDTPAPNPGDEGEDE